MTALARSHVHPTHDRAFIECWNPSTQQRLGQVAVTNATEVAEVVARAQVAQRVWARSSFAQRRAVLRHLLDAILSQMDELCAAIVEVSGKTYENALLGEIFPVCNKLLWHIQHAERHLKPERVSPGLLLHKRARIEYRPLGVVACIVPWNYPFQNIFSSLVAPLMAGNAVVLKMSEAVAWSTPRFQRLMDEALASQGFSPDTVQIVNGFAETGAALVRSAVQKILFIGSVANGRKIIEGSAQQLTPVVMELGGKDPMIICEDAHWQHAIHSALGGCFINLGQNCVASERLIVLNGIYDAWVQAMTERVAALRQGTPTRDGQCDVGVMTSPLQVRIVDELVQDAVHRGARLLVGGVYPSADNPCRYPPTLLADVTPTMRIAQEEVFGPVMLLMRAQDDADAIAIANSTMYGLQSTVLTRNRKRGKHIADALEAGASCINDFGLCYLNQNLPFGGVKYSGFGRMNGRDGLRAYTNAKAVLTDRFSFQIPPQLYPVKSGDYDKARASLQLLFSRSLRTRCVALLQLLKAAVYPPRNAP